ncbi:hypothetical protein BG32_07865 [Mesotoga sp. HF07.pep.5.2.highcov]|jgi:hypothetical protein|uniref:Uncharacterized protein n=1 Tax=Mesotoga prima MesG1.Ag.4.2 TaxID=660470 RepID=I2F2A7_9BACT|nr:MULTISPECIES: hypothetical protein [Mesotoga]MDK2943771.1 hypothetical protein [Mesotoga sp.]AFK06060.1 hypothetical protein Theba_0331 [Mesotoga prima MesG1.Ag.4.2]PIJ61871.1 hypothetical protein V513_04460 [Mesotoga sp. H07.pep.5.3]RLL90322.1 hypothetical protein BG32_07865 [Mesotoga sp. HF07.pep.5.2.highcov]HQC14685.1 hypothetical protein [Mesotoga prima]
MQVSLDQFLGAIMSRVDNLEATIDDLRLRTNIAMRLVKSVVPELTRDDVEKAVSEELEITKNAGMMEESDEIEEISSRLTDSIFEWLQGDVAELREKMDAYRKKLQEAMEAEKNRVIDVAPAGFVNQLGQEKGQKKGKLLF